MKFLAACLCALPALLSAATAALARPQVLLPRTGLTADEVALLVNEDDALSRQVGAYYAEARGIPEANVIRLRFAPGRTALPKDEFQRLRGEIERATPRHVQAYAVAWTQPYRAGCMSLTSALAFGYDERFCSDRCGPTAPSPYFDSPSLQPAGDHRLRPAMMLAARDFGQAKALIDRSVVSDGRFPAGRAYLLDTPDKARSVRAAHFSRTAKELAGVFPVEVVTAEAIADRHDVLFYFTGLPQVAALETLTFLPGALADHLTSFGGQLTDSRQMSSLAWLEAGATASYGTVVEPCNHPQKFPLPAVAMFHYAAGETAIEAYWKSVAWPGEGVFVGEPLARPFAPALRETAPGQFELRLHLPRAGRLRLERAASPMGPFRPLAHTFPLKRGANRLRFSLPAGADGYVRLRWP
jgi:uncharacterized protein (TIGR03790 family)